MKKIFLRGAVCLFLSGCAGKKTPADLIVHHAVIYTVDSVFSVQQAMAVKDGSVLETGSDKKILEKYEAPEIVDAAGHAVFPGFIDAHCHFYNYGLGLNELNLTGTASFEEVLQRVAEYAAAHPQGWIIGRGWDQNDWERKEFPSRYRLDSLFPGRPVLLKRIDGHAALASKAALQLARISDTTKAEGGLIENRKGDDPSWTIFPQRLHCSSGCKYWEPTGLLIDNAVALVEKAVPPPSLQQMRRALLAAQRNCFAAGLTTVDDAGLLKDVIGYIDTLQRKGELKIRIYAMLADAPSNFDYYLDKGPCKTPRLNVRSFKFYADGALGSRGACLKKEYADKKGWKGFLLRGRNYFAEKFSAVSQGRNQFQLNVHCIGDSAVKSILELLGSGAVPAAGRNRIEHFQVFDPADSGLFHFVIPSVQPTHATSDMYWAASRLGDERTRYAYAYKTLLKKAGLIALGTDFPVEDISPIKTFYAAVFRKDAKGYPAGGFQPEEALTRTEALKGMTIWAAFANFEEREKGSLEKGKFADFIILDTDILRAPEKEILKTKVICTYVNGEKVYAP